MLCLHCSYGTLRQLALDTLGNLAAQFILEPSDSFKSEALLALLVECITSTDKFAVVTGMVESMEVSLILIIIIFKFESKMKGCARK